MSLAQSAPTPGLIMTLWAEADAVRRAALLIGLALLALALLAPWLASFDPTQQSLVARFRPPLG
ncbi:MAG: hypothetical protein Q8K20_11000, partial [Gemmobacter sp.]|nr:hypothetical protein [Gemmobacter sp.]